MWISVRLTSVQNLKTPKYPLEEDARPKPRIHVSGPDLRNVDELPGAIAAHENWPRVPCGTILEGSVYDCPSLRRLILIGAADVVDQSPWRQSFDACDGLARA